MSVMIEWMCTACGQKTVRPESMGRPMPGTCPRALIKGRPHRWVKNRKLGTK